MMIAAPTAEAWASWAASQKLALTPSEFAPLHAAGVIDGVSCAMSVVKDPEGWAHTQASAEAPQPSKVWVGVFPNPFGVLDLVKAKLGEDLLVGDKAFDASYIVRAEPDEIAVAMLRADVRERIKRMAGEGFEALTYDSGRVLLQWRGIESRAEVLSYALQTVQLLARWS